MSHNSIKLVKIYRIVLNAFDNFVINFENLIENLTKLTEDWKDFNKRYFQCWAESFRVPKLFIGLCKLCLEQVSPSLNPQILGGLKMSTFQVLELSFFQFSCPFQIWAKPSSLTCWSTRKSMDSALSWSIQSKRVLPQEHRGRDRLGDRKATLSHTKGKMAANKEGKLLNSNSKVKIELKI